jgi:hypothetical protein
MASITTSNNGGLLTVIGIMALMILCWGVPCPAAVHDWGAYKTSLLSRLDSIDMQKQVLKRKGVPLDELEKQTAILKDSIAIVRLRIGEDIAVSAAVARNTPEQSNPNTENAPVWRQWLPKNTFDWIVVLVGCVAILAGVILLLGFVGMVLRSIGGGGGAKTRRSATVPAPPAHHEPVIFPKAVSQVPMGNAESEDTAIAQLRRRMSTEESDTAVVGLLGKDNAVQGTSSEDAGYDVKQLVIDAAAQGTSIAELSRRFHMSADQIALIVRVTRHGQDDGPAR